MTDNMVFITFVSKKKKANNMVSVPLTIIIKKELKERVRYASLAL